MQGCPPKVIGHVDVNARGVQQVLHPLDIVFDTCSQEGCLTWVNESYDDKFQQAFQKVNG